MRQTKLFSSALVGVLLLALISGSSIATAGGFDWSSGAFDNTLAATDVNDADDANSAAGEKKKGNSFGRVLTAPFRALGRLFGGDKKNDQVVRRISDKEAAKFEASKITRVKDATLSSPAEPSVPSGLALQSPEFDSHLQKGRDLLMAGDVNSAISELVVAATMNPKSGEVHKYLGIAYESKGLRDRALKSFETAVKCDSDNAEHLNNLGFLLFKDGNSERAVKYLKRAAKASPKDARIWNNLALAQFQRSNFDDAYKSFVKAVGEYDAHINMASQLQRHAMAKEAIKHLEQAQSMRPNSMDALSKLVSLYELTGRLTDAENARRTVLALKTFADAKK